MFDQNTKAIQCTNCHEKFSSSMKNIETTAACPKCGFGNIFCWWEYRPLTIQECHELRQFQIEADKRSPGYADRCAFERKEKIQKIAVGSAIALLVIGIIVLFCIFPETMLCILVVGVVFVVMLAIVLASHDNKDTGDAVGRAALGIGAGIIGFKLLDKLFSKPYQDHGDFSGKK